MAKSTSPGARRRSAGEGSVYENDGRWRGAVTWTEPDGTRRRRTVTGRTSAEARDRLDNLRRDLRLGTLAPAGPALTVADYLAGWIERHRTRVRPATWRTSEMHVRCYLAPALGRFSLARLTAADVERALAAFLRAGRPLTTSKRGRQVPRPISPQTARHIRSTLRRALADAVRADLVGRNAAADAAPPYAPHRPVVYLPAPEVRRLLTVTRDDDLGPVYALAATTGLRLGELLGLGWSDVDLAAGTLRVRRALAMNAAGGWSLADPKSATSRRTLPLSGVAHDALARQLARQEGQRLLAGTAAWQDRAGLVFTDAVGRPLRPGTVSYGFTRALAAHGLPAVRFHDLRHSAATLMLAEGVPLAVISEWLGHAGIAITAAHYAAITPQLHREAAAAMDRALLP